MLVPPPSRRGPRPRAAVALGLLLAWASACSDGSGTPAALRAAPTLVDVEFGRLCDVYAEPPGDPLGQPVLLARDVLVGPRVPPPGGPVQDASPFTWRSRDPLTLRQRLLIRRPAGSASAVELYERIDQDLPSAVHLRDDLHATIPGVPRDAALRLRFDGAAPISLDELVTRDAEGRITGLVNRSAIQLLHDPDADGEDQAPLHARILPRGSEVVIDPVVSPRDGDGWQIPAAPLGLPRGAGRSIHDLAIALRLEGPGALPRGVDQAGPVGRIGADPDGQTALLVPLRIATADESDGLLRGGVLADDSAPRLLAVQSTVLARAESAAGRPARAVVTLLTTNATAPRAEVGDRLLVGGAGGIPVGDCEVLAVLGRDADSVELEVQALAGLVDLDPRRLPGFPSDRETLRAWLVNRVAGHVELLTVYDPTTDPAHAVLGTIDSRLPDDDQEPLRELSPFTGFVLRFSEPLDPDSVRPLDNFFVATRDLFDEQGLVDDLVTALGGDPARANLAKLRTPHLVASRAAALDPTTWRIEPILGMYLDDAMRDAFAADPDDARRFDSFVHVLRGIGGITDPAGNPLTWQGDDDRLVFRIGLDLRRDAQGFPLQPDNRVVHVVRRFDDIDEDPRPSPFLAEETPRTDGPPAAQPVADLFGAGLASGGRFEARATGRRSRYVDPWNQAPLPRTDGTVGPCPPMFEGEGTTVQRSAAQLFGTPLGTPWNHSGTRQQVAYREIDLGLSLEDPNEFDLDVEAVFWAFVGSDGLATADVFEQMTLQLGHSEFRPEPCLGSFSGLPVMPSSGLGPVFADNYVADTDLVSGTPQAPAPHQAFTPQRFTIDGLTTRAAPSGENVHYHPLPPFEEPLFTFRDQRLDVQGGNIGTGSDVLNPQRSAPDYLQSPFGGGLGARITATGDAVLPTWSTYRSFSLAQNVRLDGSTGGSLTAVALPLLVDWWVWPDGADERADWSGGPIAECGQYRGPGDISGSVVGLAVSLSNTCDRTPNFRAFSGGWIGSDQRPSVAIRPGDPQWDRAAGGYTPTGSRTSSSMDNTVPWTRIDFLTRRSVVTAGLVDLFDPHRREGSPLTADPRLGPYIDPTATRLPAGVRLRPTFELFGVRTPNEGAASVEFRATGPVDPDPWRFPVLEAPASLRPSRHNVVLDPRIAGDCALRKFDDRSGGSGPRNHWTHPYHRNVTATTDSIHGLFDDAFLAPHRGSSDAFGPRDVRMLHWRFLFQNGWEDGYPVAPSIDGTALVYRLEPE